LAFVLVIVIWEIVGYYTGVGGPLFVPPRKPKDVLEQARELMREQRREGLPDSPTRASVENGDDPSAAEIPGGHRGSSPRVVTHERPDGELERMFSPGLVGVPAQDKADGGEAKRKTKDDAADGEKRGN